MALLTVRFTKITKTAKLPLIIVIIILNLLVIVTFNFLLIVHVWRSFLGNGSKNNCGQYTRKVFFEPSL